MTRDLTAEEIERYADGEIALDEAASIEQHLRACAACAHAVLQVVQMKRAIKAATTNDAPSPDLRERVRSVLESERATSPRRRSRAWWPIAAMIVLATFGFLVVRPRTSSSMPELADMHVTLLASANPVDVISTDRHTVKPWFEGRLPFNVPVPDFSSSPFRLIGGRVIYLRGNPAGYLLIGKSAHRISVFVFRDDLAPVNLDGVAPALSTLVWRSGGLTFVAVGQIPLDDLRQLQRLF